MDLLGTDLASHFVPLAAMVAMVIISRQWVVFHANKRARQDAVRLRAALRVELEGIRRIHDSNLRLVRDGAGYILSARTLMNVYRASLSRLNLLSVDEIVALVAANTAHERLEALLGIHGKPTGGYLVWRTPPDDGSLTELYQAVQDAKNAVDRALADIDSATEMETSFSRKVVSLIRQRDQTSFRIPLDRNPDAAITPSTI